MGQDAENDVPVRMTFLRRLREDARQEWAELAQRAARSHRWLKLKRRTVWRVEGWLLAWTEDAEPCSDYSARLLAETDDGDWLVPAGERYGGPWWEGYWCWWKPTHWPVYIRSRRRRSYVMVERYVDE